MAGFCHFSDLSNPVDFVALLLPRLLHLYVPRKPPCLLHGGPGNYDKNNPLRGLYCKTSYDRKYFHTGVNLMCLSLLPESNI